MKNPDFKYYPVALIILYVPFHLLEEALNNFPQWMYAHYGLPAPLSYPHWLVNNSVFLMVLLAGLFIYNRNRNKYLAFGAAILVWGLMNSMEHILFSIIDCKTAPGFYTSFLFIAISLMGFVKIKRDKLLNISLVLKSVLIAMAYWITALLIIFVSGLYLVKVL